MGSDPYSGEVHQVDLPITHLRPFILSLENKAWAGNNSTDINIQGMRMCDITGCCTSGIQNDDTDNAKFHCCGEYCTYYDKYIVTTQKIASDSHGPITKPTNP